MNKNPINKDFIIELVSKSLEEEDSSYLTNFIVKNKFKTREITEITRIILRNFSKEDICLLSDLLLKNKNDISKDLVCDLIWVCYPIRKSHVLNVLIKLSNDENWGVRESAGWLVYHLLKNYYEDFKPFLEKMIKSESPNVRRTAIIGIMRFAKHRIPEKGKELLKMIEPLLRDRNNYVKRNLGPFVIGDGFIRYYTEETVNWLKKWVTNSDEQVRWNIARVFTTAEATNHLDMAVEILGYLAKDKRKYVKQAVISALKNLIRRKPNEMLKVLREWKVDADKKEIVEDVFREVKIQF